MTKIVKLTENDLMKLVKRVIKEDNVLQNVANMVTGKQPTNATGNDRIANIANILLSVKTEMKPTTVIVSKNPKLNGMTLKQYAQTYKVTPQEFQQARALNQKMGRTAGQTSNPTQPGPGPTKAAPKPTGATPTPQAAKTGAPQTANTGGVAATKQPGKVS